MVSGAPGHGEGHNSGQAVNIAAALAVKAIMERDRIPGTLVLWPGVAEESIAGKPFLVRADELRDVAVTLFTYVAANCATSPFSVIFSAMASCGTRTLLRRCEFGDAVEDFQGTPLRGTQAQTARDGIDVAIHRQAFKSRD